MRVLPYLRLNSICRHLHPNLNCLHPLIPIINHHPSLNRLSPNLHLNPHLSHLLLSPTLILIINPIPVLIRLLLLLRMTFFKFLK